ncbi:hypothetical protein Tco_1516455 [Tanacetum coccineum]
MQWPPISASMIIGPSVPSSSPRGRKRISGFEDKLCVILCLNTIVGKYKSKCQSTAKSKGQSTACLVLIRVQVRVNVGHRNRGSAPLERMADGMIGLHNVWDTTPGEIPDRPRLNHSRTEGLFSVATFTTPPQTGAKDEFYRSAPPQHLRNKGSRLGADNLTLEGVATELVSSDVPSVNRLWQSAMFFSRLGQRRSPSEVLSKFGLRGQPGDFVYRANDASHAEDTGKLGPKWEGPYEVTEALGKGAYKLRDMDGRELPRTWNICNLKKCYL